MFMTFDEIMLEIMRVSGWDKHYAYYWLDTYYGIKGVETFDRKVIVSMIESDLK